ncbi:MAG: GFA family protein [bacterium]|jgi:hypothetical protein
MAQKQEKIAGSCYCQAVRYSARLPTRFVAHCHCDNCRRAQGAGIVTYAGFLDELFEIEAGAEFISDYTSDTGSTRRFCAVCGTTILFQGPRWPGEVHLLVANLAGELDRAPGAHVYADRAPAWCPIHDDLPRLGGTSGVDPL